MGFEFRLKTGFFETKRYDFLIVRGKLILSPLGFADQVIIISEKDIQNIILESMKSLMIEILTLDKIYQGVFCNKADYEKVLVKLKENINKKIVCEYEGGSENG